MRSQTLTPAIAVDDAGIAVRKADKQRRYVQQQVPLLRLVGFAILWSVVVADRAGADDSWPTLFAVGGAFLAYSLGSWAILLLQPDSRTRTMGLFFLGVDPFVWMIAVYTTGGETSWLYVMALVRAADQVNTSRRQALTFGGIGLAAYLSMLLYIVLVDGRAIDWMTQLGHFVFLAGCSVYLSMAAGTAERLRGQLAQAVRTARESIRSLRAQSVELERARASAESASHAKSQFLASVSHEFRTPLNAIVNYAELLHEEMPGESPQVREDIEHINRSARHLRGLINDVIELSRLEVGRATLNVHPFSVSSVVADATSSVLPTLRGNRNTLEVTGVDDAGTLLSDSHKVRQILINLIGNAGKFTTAGHITVTCTRLGSGDQAEVLFRVTDTGIGMNAEQLARIQRFEPFVQADGGISRRFGGTGLGLTISHRFARLMGGELEIESEAGRGTTTTCRLPAVLPAADWQDEAAIA